MGTLNTIFTNTAIRKMALFSLSESEVLDAFNHGETERSKYGDMQAIKKYPGREIGVLYKKDPRDGKWVILSVWKRDRR
jgi:hypothetical protein